MLLDHPQTASLLCIIALAHHPTIFVRTVVLSHSVAFSLALPPLPPEKGAQRSLAEAEAAAAEVVRDRGR